jgi:hypothetical protein
MFCSLECMRQVSDVEWRNAPACHPPVATSASEVLTGAGEGAVLFPGRHLDQGGGSDAMNKTMSLSLREATDRAHAGGACLA